MDIKVMRYMVSSLNEKQFQNLVEQLAWLEKFKKNLEQYYHPDMKDCYNPDANVARSYRPFFDVTTELTGNDHSSWIEFSVKTEGQESPFQKKPLKIGIDPSRSENKVGFTLGAHWRTQGYYSNLEKVVEDIFNHYTFYAFSQLRMLDFVRDATHLEYPNWSAVKTWEFKYTGNEED